MATATTAAVKRSQGRSPGTHRTPPLTPRQAGLRTSTEYEGPSLREKLAHLFEGPQAGAAAVARKKKGIAPGETQSDDDVMRGSAFAEKFKKFKAGEAERKKRGDLPQKK